MHGHGAVTWHVSTAFPTDTAVPILGSGLVESHMSWKGRWKIKGHSPSWVFGKLIALLSIGLLGYGTLPAFKRFVLSFEQPDATGDAIITIHDILVHIGAILIAPGTVYQSFVPNRTAQLLEMPHWIWSVLLSGLVYFALYCAVYFVRFGWNDK